ncbi:MAG: hypothetical protein IPH57_01415 [Saprospiraceae bacterium]|nr:hypothetical protein [Saprospiraceae bacterium]
MKKYFIYLVLIFSVSSCMNNKPDDNGFSVTIGLNREPQALLPVKRNADIERQVNQYIFTQAADYDPVTLKNTAILFENLPDEIIIDTGKYRNTYRYNLSFRKEAEWENGSPITAYDYLFTVKMILNPGVEVHPALRILYSKIRNIEIDRDNPKKFSVFTEKDYMLSDEMVTNMEIFPEYFYDSLKIMRSFEIKDLLNPGFPKTKLDSLNSKGGFASRINSAYFMRDHVSGAGPYRLESWTANNYLILSKKKNWWVEKLERHSYLTNNPEKIIFKVIPDKMTSFTELKSGNIDVLSGELGNDFVKMKNDPLYKDKFHFLSPLSTQYFAVLINNRNEIFKDKLVRKAIARLIDVDLLLKTFGTGDERKAVSPIHPAKDYFDKSLSDIDFNLDEASALLKRAGWNDTNGNGIPDKMINGKKKELKFSITITGKPFGKSLALQLKENAIKLGIEVEVISRNGKAFKQDLDALKFDLAPIVGSQDLADIDPYPEWHSSNTATGGSNVSGFANQQCDKVIEEIRTTHDKALRKKLYLEFQKIIYDEQPVIFLFIPTNNIIVSKKFNVNASVKRPGYFANTFTLRK